MISYEERQKLMADNPPVCTGVHGAQAYFNWSWKGCGFGQLTFSYQDGEWSCDTEMMGPESTRKLLHAFADHVADNLKPIIEEERRLEDLEDQRRREQEAEE